MNSKPVFRIIFAVIVAIGSLFFLYGARNISIENAAMKSNICETEADKTFARSNTEFIFFESVTKYLVISLVK